MKIISTISLFIFFHFNSYAQITGNELLTGNICPNFWVDSLISKKYWKFNENGKLHKNKIVNFNDTNNGWTYKFKIDKLYFLPGFTTVVKNNKENITDLNITYFISEKTFTFHYKSSFSQIEINENYKILYLKGNDLILEIVDPAHFDELTGRILMSNESEKKVLAYQKKFGKTLYSGDNTRNLRIFKAAK